MAGSPSVGRCRLVTLALKAEAASWIDRGLRSATIRSATSNRRVRRAAAICNLAVLAYVAGGLLPGAGFDPKGFASMATPVDAAPWLMMLVALSSAAASLMLLTTEPGNAPAKLNYEAANGSGNGIAAAAEICLSETRAGQIEAHMMDRIGHDLRTPLTAIIGFSDMMWCEMHGPLGSDRYQSYAGHIRDSGVTLLQTIETALASAEHGQYETAAFGKIERKLPPPVGSPRL